MDAELKYVPVRPQDRDSLVAQLASLEPGTIAEALYSAAYHDPDWRWVQGLCLEHLASPHIPVRWAAVTCLGDLAMFHKELDLDLVLPALRKASWDPAIRSPAEMSLMLIEHAVPKE